MGGGGGAVLEERLRIIVGLLGITVDLGGILSTQGSSSPPILTSKVPHGALRKQENRDNQVAVDVLLFLFGLGRILEFSDGIHS